MCSDLGGCSSCDAEGGIGRLKDGASIEALHALAARSLRPCRTFIRAQRAQSQGGHSTRLVPLRPFFSLTIPSTARSNPSHLRTLVHTANPNPTE